MGFIDYLQSLVTGLVLSGHKKLYKTTTSLFVTAPKYRPFVLNKCLFSNSERQTSKHALTLALAAVNGPILNLSLDYRRMFIIHLVSDIFSDLFIFFSNIRNLSNIQIRMDSFWEENLA